MNDVLFKPLQRIVNQSRNSKVVTKSVLRFLICVDTDDRRSAGSSYVASTSSRLALQLSVPSTLKDARLWLTTALRSLSPSARYAPHYPLPPCTH